MYVKTIKAIFGNSILSEIQFNHETIDTLEQSDNNYAILFILKDESGNKKAYSFYTDGNVTINYTDDYNKIKELFPNLLNKIPKPKEPIICCGFNLSTCCGGCLSKCF